MLLGKRLCFTAYTTDRKDAHPMTSTEAMIYQLKNLKGKPLKQKVEHIVTYFWLPIVVTLAILIGLGSYIVHIVTMKDTALNVICLNAYSDLEVAKSYVTDFAENAGIDLEEYEVYISTDLTLNDADLNSSYNTVQVLVAQVAAHSVDILAGDQKNTIRYFYQEMYHDLTQVLTPAQQEAYGEYFLYADMAVVRRLEDQLLEEAPEYPDPTKPEEMEEPVPVALLVPEGSGFMESCYPYHKNNVVVGIVATTDNMENALAFLDHIMQ